MRNFKFTILPAVIFLLASCTLPDGISLTEYDTVLATIGNETRTSIGPDEGGSRKVLWSEGDRIIVSTGLKNMQGTYKAVTYGSSTAEFVPEDPSKALDFSTGAIAGYPAENMYIGTPDADKEIFFTLPELQNYVPGSFDEGAMPMVSDVTFEPVLNFHNAAGVIRLNLSTLETGVRISEITLTSSAHISGDCGYIPKSRKMFFDETTPGGNHVVLRCGNGVEISSEPVAFHIVVPFQTYSDMSINVVTTDQEEQTFHLKDGKAIEVKRSTITTIPLVINDLQESLEPTASIKIESTTFDNIRFSFAVKNTSSYYFGFQTSDSFFRELESGNLLESILHTVLYTSPLKYTGNILSFNDETKEELIVPGQSYVIWAVPYRKDGQYKTSDIKYAEATAKSFEPGGSIEVSYSGLYIDKTCISMTLTAPEALFIYATLVYEDTIAGYATEEDIIRFLLDPESMSNIYSAETETLERKFLHPGHTLYVLSVAVDKDGRYGPLLMEEMQTDPIPYNDLKVAINKDQNAVGNTSSIEWSVSNGKAAQYKYILTPTSDYLWTDILESSVLYAQENMYLSPIYYVNTTSGTSASLSGMDAGQEYIIIVAAVDSKGGMSVADSWIFNY
ncbi:MAG: hypothetical protein II194_03565 [Bacteroidales bacterium]|nr:hypothetical protein [Bacteroidales bacterium]